MIVPHESEGTWEVTAVADWQFVLVELTVMVKWKSQSFCGPWTTFIQHFCCIKWVNFPFNQLLHLHSRTHCCVCWPVRDERLWTRHAGNHGCSSSVDQSNAAAVFLLSHVLCPSVFWPLLVLCVSSCLSRCPAIAACSSRQTGWRRGSVFSWVELKWSMWRGWDPSSPSQSTTAPSIRSTRAWCPDAFACTPGACRGSPCCWKSMLSHYHLIASNNDPCFNKVRHDLLFVSMTVTALAPVFMRWGTSLSLPTVTFLSCRSSYKATPMRPDSAQSAKSSE